MRAADSQAAVREDGLASYPDPERRPQDQIFRQIVVEPRVRNVRCREERPKCRGLSGATGTETMSVCSLKTTPRSVLGSRELWFGRKSIETETETMTPISHRQSQRRNTQ